MSFLYPLFLAAGAALAIPVLIHLFNLRRYKTVYFPHTRFLKNIQLRSQKQSQVRYKLLLALRLLFLTLLILAFAQPYWATGEQQNTSHRLQVIYIDNSGSMSLKKGPRRLADIAKETARKQVLKAPPGSKFVLLTNDKPVSYHPIPADKVLPELNNIDISSSAKTAEQVLSTVQTILQSETAPAADVYYYSDFQQNVTGDVPDVATAKNIRFNAITIQSADISNVFVDTAWLTSPVLQTGASNELIVRTRLAGAVPEETPVLQLSVNGQVKSAATLNFDDKQQQTDTLTFRVNDAAWQRISLSLNDKYVRFDDTFNITARSAPNLSVLALNEGSPNPFVQAAFRAYKGFRLTNAAINSTKEDWTKYSLVILNGCTRITPQLGEQIAGALQRGQAICIFPGKTNNIAAINEGLQKACDLAITGIDTAVQTATTLQQGNELVKDLFEVVPDNVQLPTANWHYIIKAGLTANQQSVISFRDGDPLFAQYSPSKGKLYISSVPVDIQSGNFPSSYFFAPFLYQMAVHSTGGNVYALTLGNNQPAYLPLDNASERNMVHIYTSTGDAIPPQRTEGAGLNVFVDNVIKNAGFYPLSTDAGDTTVVAVNTDRSESYLESTDIAQLKSQWKDVDIRLLDAGNIGTTNAYSSWDSFPLWKVCVILAVIMLAAETWVLAGSLRKPTAATQ